jgi:hypothetical protein
MGQDRTVPSSLEALLKIHRLITNVRLVVGTMVCIRIFFFIITSAGSARENNKHETQLQSPSFCQYHNKNSLYNP